MEKECFKCKQIKPLSDFYKHKGMGDGYLGKCKDCTKKDTKQRADELLKDKDWHEKEKERQRDKYYRLGYKEKHKPTPESRKKSRVKYFKDYPEKLRAKSRCTKEKRVGFEKHHWSYKEGHEKDIIWLTKKEHHKLHRYLDYHKTEFQYMTLDGVLLDTKDNHIDYWNKIKEL